MILWVKFSLSGGEIEGPISTERRVAFLLNGNMAHFYWSSTSVPIHLTFF